MPVSLERVTRFVARCASVAAASVLPSRCFVCRGWLPPVQSAGACAGCWSSLAALSGPVCATCGAPLADAVRGASPAASRCPKCCMLGSPLDGGVAAVGYDAIARRFLARAKEQGHRELFPLLGSQLAIAIHYRGLHRGTDLLIPAPSAPLARLRRGFDPASELARAVHRATGVPFRSGYLHRRWLQRRPLKGLSARARWLETQGLFHASRVPRGASVLLVDDVLTTGATARACALALLRAGAGRVRVATWARTPLRGP